MNDTRTYVRASIYYTESNSIYKTNQSPLPCPEESIRGFNMRNCKKKRQQQQQHQHVRRISLSYANF